ncbi:UNVERIFIED_CONTAM: hypothetical protein HDU68_007843 [Siphonaria sp. JEL0065]|nr:hypothetical protein HDU68_007843 [Siphonaria sp. JEL0065]
MQHDQSQHFTHLQLHDDMNAFDGQHVNQSQQHDGHIDQTGLYGAIGHDDGYYGYYPDQVAQYTPQQPQQQPIAPAPQKSSSSSNKRPLRPAPTTGISTPATPSFPISAPSAASSHVRTLPAKNAATAAASAGSGTPTFGAVANQSAFINKLYTMLEEADQSLISWDHTGTFFIVKNTTGSKLIL